MLPVGERGTYRTGKDQLDYIVVSDALKKMPAPVHIGRHGVYTAKGEKYPTVTSRRMEASDHAAVVAKVTVWPGNGKPSHGLGTSGARGSFCDNGSAGRS